MLDEPKNLPAFALRLRDIVAEYEAKREAIPATVAAFDRAVTDAELNACIGGTYAGSVWPYRGKPSLDQRTIAANLLEGAWRHVYAGLNLDTIAPASDRSRFELAMKSPVPFTIDNIGATFGKYLLDTRGSILRGLAEAFGQLDPAFKSHDKMRVGVKGLPKRVILSSVTDYTDGWGSQRVRDTLNAVRVFNGKGHLGYHETRDEAGNVIEHGISEILRLARTQDGGVEFDGMRLKRFGNGNAHLFFGPEALLQVNRALAEYYGEVLPDCPEERPAKATGTAVSKDLQFYRTPDEIADRLVKSAGLREGMQILEPSCGDGSILDAVVRYARKERLYELRVGAVEYDRGRADMARARGHKVLTANFLQVDPSPTYDVVLMNPPFYGKHYQKHVEHARRFLKPGGRVLAILPITALTDHGFVESGKWLRDRWEDLPVGSFSESGTNINTGIATFFRRD